MLVKRDDLLHPIISGNKWRKLKYNLIEAKTQGYKSIVSFGGPFSNHIHALASAGRIFSFNTHGIIRGPELDLNNPTLRFAKACGMKLTAIDRKTYRKKADTDFLEQLKHKHPLSFVVPEGGSNHLALEGVAEMAQSLPECDYVFCATGSGGTLAGIIEGLDNQCQIRGIAVLKQAEYLNQEIKTLSQKANTQKNWQLLTAFHQGGYGKVDQNALPLYRLLATQLPLEPIYTGKMITAIFSLLSQGYFAKGTRICAIHTGGLQGLAGIKYLEKIKRR